MISGVILTAGGGLGLVLVAIVLAVTLARRRRRLDAGLEAGSMAAERAVALRTVQEQIDRGSRFLWLTRRRRAQTASRSACGQ